MWNKLVRKLFKARRVEIGFTKELSDEDVVRCFMYGPKHPLRMGVQQLIYNMAASLINEASASPDESQVSAAALGGVSALLELQSEIDQNMDDAKELYVPTEGSKEEDEGTT